LKHWLFTVVFSTNGATVEVLAFMALMFTKPQMS
jgi:hypothetical protein